MENERESIQAILMDYQKYAVWSRMHPNVQEYQFAFQQANTAWKSNLNQLIQKQQTLQVKNQGLQEALQKMQKMREEGEYQQGAIKDAQKGTEIRLENQEELSQQQLRRNWEILGCGLVMLASTLYLARRRLLDD